MSLTSNFFPTVSGAYIVPGLVLPKYLMKGMKREAYMKKYYEANKEKMNERATTYYLENKEHLDKKAKERLKKQREGDGTHPQYDIFGNTSQL